MYKIGEFIYPWGGGHYSRMMRFDRALAHQQTNNSDNMEIHYSSKGTIHQKLLERFADNPTSHIHEILMPTPIDGNMGPSVSKSLANLIFSLEKNPPLVMQIANYLREERKLYDTQNFDLVINDGDMGSNILAKNRNIPSLFITNQFKPKLYKSRSYLYPALLFISKQIAKASKILVADSPPPHTICEYNLNFSEDLIKDDKVVYVGHFATDVSVKQTGQVRGSADLRKLLELGDFGYWMRTGNKSTNDGTGKRYEDVFATDEIKNSERRLISHARDDPKINSVMDADKNRYTIKEAVDKKIDWVQIDIGFLSESDKDVVLEMCDYAVLNGSHTVMGEIMGIKKKPIIGIPIYDEHTNNIRWAHERGLGILANNTDQIIKAIRDIKNNKSEYADKLCEFAKNFDGRGAQHAAKIASEMLH